MSTLAQATYELSKILQSTVERTATAGTASSLTDNHVQRSEPDTHFALGTIWFLSGNKAGKSAAINTYTTKVFSFDDPGGGVVAAADRYAAAPADYPRYLLIQAINRAMTELGIPQENTALASVADQEAYTLPSGVYNVLRVELASETSAPLNYMRSLSWEEINGTIKFDRQYRPQWSGNTIRLTYLVPPASIALDADVISNSIHINRLVWTAAVYALRWRVVRTEDDEPDKTRLLNEALVNAQTEASRWPIPPQMGRDPHLAGY